MRIEPDKLFSALAHPLRLRTLLLLCNEEEIMAVFRATRDEVRERVRDLVAHLMQEQQGTGT